MTNMVWPRRLLGAAKAAPAYLVFSCLISFGLMACQSWHAAGDSGIANRGEGNVAGHAGLISQPDAHQVAQTETFDPYRYHHESLVAGHAVPLVPGKHVAYNPPLAYQNGELAQNPAPARRQAANKPVAVKPAPAPSNTAAESGVMTRCGLRLVAKSADAVGDPCQTTADFARSLGLSEQTIASIERRGRISARAAH